MTSARWAKPGVAHPEIGQQPPLPGPVTDPLVLLAALAAAVSASPGAAVAVPPPVAHAPSDYDGDGRSDLAVWDPAEGRWRFARICELDPDTVCGFSHGHLTGGGPALMTAAGDFNGDGRADPASFDRDSGIWMIVPLDEHRRRVQFGAPGDIAVPADYDGDQQADLAVYRDGLWTIHQSATLTTLIVSWRQPGDLPVPGDYSGEGRAQIAFYRGAAGSLAPDPGWYLHGGPPAIGFGLPHERPVSTVIAMAVAP